MTLKGAITDLVELMYPHEQMVRSRAVRSAIADDGTINPAALRTTVRFPLTWTIAGALSVGTNVAGPRYVPQNATLKNIRADVEVAPIGSEATFVLAIDGVAGPAVTITAGETSGTSNISVAVTAGQVLTLNATAVGSTTPAETATVSVTYAPAS